MKESGRRLTLRMPPTVRRMLEAVGKAAPSGTAVYAVGGCVRDWYLGRPGKDLDLVVVGDPRPVVRFCIRRFGGREESFDEFGTFRLMLRGRGRLDVARARKETYAAPAALPRVEPAPLEEDLRRRDFTVNAMAVALSPGAFGGIVDPWGGRGDLRAGQLRVLHGGSFRDDPTRIFRAARFSCRFGFSLEPRTSACLAEAVFEGDLFLLSRERIRQELLRVLEEDDPRCPLERLKEWRAHPAIYHRFSWDPSFANHRSAQVRLGLLAMHLEARDGGRGVDFLDSLHLERALSQALRAAVRVWSEKASPRSRLPALAEELLKASGVPPHARAPLFISGADLTRAGLRPGIEYGRLLKEGARAQWAGEFKTRSGALRWLARQPQSR